MRRTRLVGVVGTLLVPWVLLSEGCDDDDEAPIADAAIPDAGDDAALPMDGAAADALPPDGAVGDAAAQLTQAEIDFLTFTREEEKLARDVYIELEGVYPNFANIAESEQAHMDAVLVLLDRYGIPDPAAGNTAGVFTDATIQSLYNDLVAQGSTSTIEAIKVGLAIEELDIRDLSAALMDTTPADIRTTIENLLRGSRNHLRSFYQALLTLGETYTPQYLDEATFNQIVTSPMETGSPAGF